MSHPFKHFRTITHHRHLVIHYCFKLGIGFQGLKHDLSKYSPVEFWNGAKYYSGIHSPISDEKKARGYSKAWLHHKGRNKHHFEYWIYYSTIEKRYVSVRMPIQYVKEMFCDRLAASKTYLKKRYTDAYPYEYFTSNNDGIGMHEETKILIETWLSLVKDKGEKAAFKIIKQQKEY